MIELHFQTMNVARRTVDGKKTESIMECIQITPAGGVFFCGGNLEKLTNKEIEEELHNANCNIDFPCNIIIDIFFKDCI